MKKLSLLAFCGTVLIAAPMNAQVSFDNLSAEQMEVLRKFEVMKQQSEQQRADVFSVGMKTNAPQKLKNPMRFGQKTVVNRAAATQRRKATTEIFAAGWSNTLRSQAEFDQFSVIDANADGKTWAFRPYDEGGETMYQYSTTNQADDWMISPGLQLKGGKTYYVEFKTRCVQSTYAEKIEVKYGTAATAEAMVNEILPVTEVANTSYNTHQKMIKPSADGVYYIGFHAVSDAFKINLMVADVSVVAAPEPKSPAGVTNATVTADPSAALKATITFNNPTLAFDGSALGSITGVKIMSNGEQKANLSTTAIGGAMSFVDESLKNPGIAHYTIVPYNEFGDGKAISVSAYIGLDSPAAPENVVLSNDPESMVLSWNPSKAAHNGVIVQDDVSYNIYTVVYDNYGSAVLDKKKGSTLDGETSFSVGQGADEGKPAVLELAVEAENGSGTSDDFTVSNSVLLGKPDKAPFDESFADATPAKLLIPFGEGTGVSYGQAGAGFTVDEDANGDGGSAYLQTLSSDSVGFYTYKVNLANTTQPKLVFSKKTSADVGIFYAYAEKADGTRVNLLEEDLSAVAPSEGWKTYKYDLSQFKDERYILAGFAYAEMSGGFVQHNIYIDNIHVGDLAARDLKASVSAPAKLERGASSSATVRINNIGDEDVDSYRVLVTADGKEIYNEVISEPLASYKNKIIEVPFTVNSLTEGNYFNILVKVTADNDANEDNDEVQHSVEIKEPSVSPVENLAAENVVGAGKMDIRLTWDKPSPLVEKTESFEDYEDWNIADDGLGPWIRKDMDGGATGGNFVYNGNTEVTYENMGERFAYIVFNDHNFGGYDLQNLGIKSFAAHAGDKCLASMWGAAFDFASGEYQNCDNNDWLISPEFAGGSVSFWAKNLVARSADGNTYDLKQAVEVLYSTADQEVGSFTSIDTCYAEGGEWKQFTVNVPAGAKYFALRNVTDVKNTFLLLLDDVTYTVNGGEAVSYNVYRDGVFIVNTTNLTFTDADVADVPHTYQVVAVYGNGQESSPRSVSTVTSGITTVEPAADKPFDVYAVNGVRVLQGATSLNGLPKGIYIVNNQKIVVR